MKAYFLFGSSLLISVLYISIYTLLSPLTDLFFSLSLLFLVAFFTLNVDRKKSLFELLHLNFLRNLKMEIPKKTNLTVSYGLGYPRSPFG
ncbi:hypothetical protein SAMN05421668_1212 [Halolactibacillus miurensis]|uniref:Uncharacterized protein n=1 Tax=Halolactibacillus miurensis TaxID=306541 RepID=A0A1I6U244_9BACI|nr:hypothetical protein SAMN05421668_1212 [Halolactibacillus miurensis]